MGAVSWNRVTIDTGALVANYRTLCRRLGESVRLLAMVKSDGYGHGLVNAANAFTRAGCSAFGVAEIGEGVALREAGCTGEIFIFLGCPADQIDYLVRHRLTPVVFSREDLLRIAAAAERHGTVIDSYLKFDCGMARLGFAPADAPDLADWCRGLPSIRVRGAISHYPCADDRHSPVNEQVFQQFQRVLMAFAGFPGFVRSLCNSGGTLYLPATHGDLVRCGIALYGYYPDGAAGRIIDADNALQPAMRFATTVLQINEVRAGSGVSYGHTYQTERDSRLAVLPVGYSDGYPRALSNRGVVLIGGRRAPIRGRICMNMCMADVTDIPEAAAGSEAVLLGGQGHECIDADEIAGWCGSISYEILCTLGTSNDRVIVEGS